MYKGSLVAIATSAQSDSEGCVYDMHGLTVISGNIFYTCLILHIKKFCTTSDYAIFHFTSVLM